MSQANTPPTPGQFGAIGVGQNPAGPIGTAPSGTGEPAPEMLREMLETFRRSGAGVVFGESRQVNGATVIPVAVNVVGFGFGQGRGPAQTGAGGGGGGFARSRPLGFLVVENNQVHFRPTVDVSRVAMTGLIVGGILAALWVVFRR